MLTDSEDRLMAIADTLPDVIENVSQAQKHQLLEVTKQQEILDQVKVYFRLMHNCKAFSNRYLKIK